MVGSPARTDEESSKQQQANRITIEDGFDGNNPPPASAARDLLRPVGRAIVSIRVISTTLVNATHIVVVNVFCSFSFCVGDGGWRPRPTIDISHPIYILWYFTSSFETGILLVIKDTLVDYDVASTLSTAQTHSDPLYNRPFSRHNLLRSLSRKQFG